MVSQSILTRTLGPVPMLLLHRLLPVQMVGELLITFKDLEFLVQDSNSNNFLLSNLIKYLVILDNSLVIKEINDKDKDKDQECRIGSIQISKQAILEEVVMELHNSNHKIRIAIPGHKGQEISQTNPIKFHQSNNSN